MTDPRFLFVVCQRGAESALKAEFARINDRYRFAFSRPGFVTFKLPEDHGLPESVGMQSVFARTCGFSLGKMIGENAEANADQLWQLVGDRRPDHLHVWQRDWAVPGDRDFEPGVSPLADDIARIIVERRPAKTAAERILPINLVARPEQHVLDCVLVEPDQWWIGWHQAASLPSRWPGGVPRIEMAPEAVSRAYLKMTESLLWSCMPIAAGDHCIEIGSSPGGSCLALLERGLIVTGIDPAEMDPTVLEHKNFTHIRVRGADLKRREFRHTKWLMADSNVAPKHTLDTVEHIVTNRQVNIQGLLLTLKLSDWALADSISGYLERIRRWGYPLVYARQLAFNRQEICVATLRRRPRRHKAKRPNRPTRR